MYLRRSVSSINELVNMKYRLTIILIIAFCQIVNCSFGQTEKCDTIYDFTDKEASFKNGGTDVLNYFNESILKIIYDANSDDFPPTSFKMTLLINNNDEVEGISAIRGDYSEEIKGQIFETLKNEAGWKSGEIDGQKVCSKFYFIIGCILWH